MVYSGDDSKARRNTAAGVKRTLHLLGCEKASGKSHPALEPSAAPVHRQERGFGYGQTQTLPVCRPETTEHFPFLLPVTQAGRGGNRLPATQSQEPGGAGSTLQSQAAEPPAGGRDPGAPVSVRGVTVHSPLHPILPRGRVVLDQGGSGFSLLINNLF